MREKVARTQATRSLSFESFLRTVFPRLEEGRDSRVHEDEKEQRERREREGEDEEGGTHTHVNWRAQATRGGIETVNFSQRAVVRV